MKKKGSELIGLPVICLDEGCKKMEIKDLLYSLTEYRLMGFIVEQGKYFHDKKIIKFENVKSIDENAVILQNKQCIERIKDVIENPELTCLGEKLLDMEVITEDGQNVGLIQDITIDLPTGNLTELIISEGILDDLMVGRPILPIEANLDLTGDTLVINDVTNQSIIHNTGGIKKIFSME